MQNPINKKYFVQFLPAEGEVINEGDTIMNEDGTLLHDIFLIHLQHGDKKAVLHLCCNEINVGDEFIDIYGDKAIYQEEDYAPEYFENTSVYKILGRVKPDADVKEGDSFDEDEKAQAILLPESEIEQPITDIVYVTVRLKITRPSHIDIDTIIQEMDYDFVSSLSGTNIHDTEIDGFEVK